MGQRSTIMLLTLRKVRVVPDYVKFYTHMALHGFMTSTSVNNLLLHGLIFSIGKHTHEPLSTSFSGAGILLTK